MIFCGVRQQQLIPCLVVLLLLRIRVRVLQPHHLPNDHKTSTTHRRVMAVTAALVVMVAKVLLVVKAFGNVSRRSKQSQKALGMPVLRKMENVRAVTTKL